ncbi:transcriptional repressor [Nakamurella flava]|uniref:Transcriptional repressor n=1 Tax=Nakamurella flava TaxID=2576308 RepID=A0A4V6Y6U4_9ACTN|nr:transcriptional repressor [Nakamurella flava]
MPDLADRLRRAGLRVTSQRLAVLRVVADHPHSTADQVLDLVAPGRTAVAEPTAPGARISRQAVYDVLSAGVTAGLLRRIEPAGSPARYETRTGDNHHHLICRICGHTADVDCAIGAAPCLHPADQDRETVGSDGFLVEEAEIVFWGRCAACAAPRTATDPSP